MIWTDLHCFTVMTVCVHACMRARVCVRACMCVFWVRACTHKRERERERERESERDMAVLVVDRNQSFCLFPD